MRKAFVKGMACALVILFSLILVSGPAWAASGPEDTRDKPQQDAAGEAQGNARERLDRIDFGNTYIIGQTIKSGAVYLLQRKKSEIKSMLKYREDYRKEILDGFTVEDMKASDRKQGEKPGQEKPASLKGEPGFAETGSGM